MKKERAHRLVKKAYAKAARNSASCCGSAPCCSTDSTVALPEADLGLSCGDPVAFSQLKPGDTVLDLGSGAGRDVFTAATIVGQTGLVIGVDITPEMLALANRNLKTFSGKTGLKNVEFRPGEIENLPVEDSCVDVVISNCVINLSPDKPRVFREAFRVLKPGGRMVISDIVLNHPLPEELSTDTALYSACIAGAMLRDNYLKAIREAGFGKVDVIKEKKWSPAQAEGDPCTGNLGDLLSSVSASSITILAVK